MKILYCLFLILESLYGSNAFVRLLPIRSLGKKPHLVVLHASNKNISIHNPHNNTMSRVYKMNFANDREEEQLFTPKYKFGLTEFDMILLRIYVYMVITIYCFTMIFDNIKK